MSAKMMEQQIAALQQRVEKLEAKTIAATRHSWRGVVGTLESDDLSREAARLGAEWRARENKRR